MVLRAPRTAFGHERGRRFRLLPKQGGHGSGFDGRKVQIQTRPSLALSTDFICRLARAQSATTLDVPWDKPDGIRVKGTS